MHETSPPSPLAVVVGIDGSRGAVDAAMWAIDEAVDRDVPLRLLYAIEPPNPAFVDCHSVAHDFATAEAAIRDASMAIESTDRPVKIEAEILRDRPAGALLAASRTAAMICVGTLGSNHASGKRMGSTVTALMSRAHCPVAVVPPRGPKSADPGWVVAEFVDSPGGIRALEHAIEEARLRSAPLRVLSAWRPHYTDIHDVRAASEGTRQAKAHLERSLHRYRRLNPTIDIEAVAVPGNPLNYLARHADSIQLLVLGHEPSEELAEFAGPSRRAALTGVHCVVLISDLGCEL